MMASPSASTKKEEAEYTHAGELNLDDIILTIPSTAQGALTSGGGLDEDWPQAMKSLSIDEERVGSSRDGTPKSKPSEIAFANDQAPPPGDRLNRNISNQSTIDSGLSRNSHLDTNDPGIRRMFGLNATSNTERQRRLRLLMDQCETVRFPFKKKLILGKYAFCCSIIYYD